MKSFKTTTLASLLIILISCGGPKRPSANGVDSFMEFLTLKIDLAESSFDNFMIGIPKKGDDKMIGFMMPTLHKMMMKQIKEERVSINTSRTFEADEKTKKLSEELKEAGINIIEAYIQGGEQELDEVKTLVAKGETINSPNVTALLSKFEVRLKKEYNTFDKIQKELAKEYNIIMY
jgi:hypothetical protein